MARAVTRLAKGPVTAETVRKLNAEIGAEPDETLVQAVVEAAPSAKAN
jgi:hypothetical protein